LDCPLDMACKYCIMAPSTHICVNCCTEYILTDEQADKGCWICGRNLEKLNESEAKGVAGNHECSSEAN
jgi:predicted  nucleic acid-binding Zn-ribbon protein